LAIAREILGASWTTVGAQRRSIARSLAPPLIESS
jgi:hypothetical protein